MRTYRIVEDRSCGIVHIRFTGSLEDCKKWLKDNCSYDEDTNDYYSNVVFCDRSLIYIDDTCNDPENVNGNNEKMENLEIFDKDGKALHIADVIYSFIKNVAEENNKDIEDVLVGVDVGVSKEKTPVWIYTTEPVDNGYDAIDLHNFGKPIKVNCI